MKFSNLSLLLINKYIKLFVHKLIDEIADIVNS